MEAYVATSGNDANLTELCNQAYTRFSVTQETSLIIILGLFCIRTNTPTNTIAPFTMTNCGIVCLILFHQVEFCVFSLFQKTILLPKQRMFLSRSEFDTIHLLFHVFCYVQQLFTAAPQLLAILRDFYCFIHFHVCFVHDFIINNAKITTD